MRLVNSDNITLAVFGEKASTEKSILFLVFQVACFFLNFHLGVHDTIFICIIILGGGKQPMGW